MEHVLEIPDDATEFVANGKTYRKSQRISFARYGLMEEFNLELGYGRTPKEIFAEQQVQFDLLNKQKFAECAVSIHNSMSGIARIVDRAHSGGAESHPMFKQCALFWNYEGEDVRYLSDELLEEKLKDWAEAGIDAAFFFGQAVRNVPGLLAAYRTLTKDYSAGQVLESA